MVQRVTSILIFFVALFVNDSKAEIYRYQDENGSWHFSDKKPVQDKNVELLVVAPMATKSQQFNKKVNQDLLTYLSDLVKPGNEIEKATMSVVKIVTPLGSGSGFFVNEHGYIITNKHVVRHHKTKHWLLKQEKTEQKLTEMKEYFAQKKVEIKQYEKNLENYKKRVAEANKSDKSSMQTTYDYYFKQYKKMKNEFIKNNNDYVKASEEFASLKRKTAQSETTNQFKIILKDGTELQARLVRLSSDYDLALLQLSDDYKTPYLKNETHFTQAMDVYAIGSPLGFKDYVTKGIIMGQERGYIATDTQILPGNSGGPLITPEGEVVGVNTAVYSVEGTIGAEVFGYAIPIATVESEFANDVYQIATQE